MNKKRLTLYTIGSILLIYFISICADVFIFTTWTTTSDASIANTYISNNELPAPPRQFFHDGCSSFPDALLWHDFSEACFLHDIGYWAGGLLERKQNIDLQLREDIGNTGPLGPIFAYVMYYGVQYFGNSLTTRLIDANWGYGWNNEKP